MTTRRTMSPLAAARVRTQQRIMRPPPELILDPTLPSEDAPPPVYCPVRHRVEGEERKMCGDVDCGRCELLAQELDERAPDHTWVCTRCVVGLRPLPHWKDGECEGCGRESIVLMLAVPKGDAP